MDLKEMIEKSYLKTVSSNFLQIDYKKLELDSCKFHRKSASKFH